jgi:hypothetical protein
MYSDNLPSVHGQRTKDPHLKVNLKNNGQNVSLSNINATRLAASTPPILQLQATIICKKPNIEMSNVVTPKVEEKTNQN